MQLLIAKTLAIIKNQKMFLNLNYYFNEKERSSTCSSLVTLSSDILGKAKMIEQLDRFYSFLERKYTEPTEDQKDFISSYMFEHIVDLVRILIFCENYMKAELIINGFCIHKIKKELSEFKNLAKDQYSRPVTIKEIHDIENFKRIDESTVTHKALKNTTLGIKELINSEAYTKYYEFEKSDLIAIKEIADKRNSLHFTNSLEISISRSFLDSVKRLDEFSKEIVLRRVTQ